MCVVLAAAPPSAVQVVRFGLPVLAEHAFGIGQVPASLWDKYLSFLHIVLHSVQGQESSEES